MSGSYADHIYVSERGANAISGYLRLPLEHPEVFHSDLFPVTGVVLAYSNPHQGTAKAIASLCVTYGLPFEMIDVPRTSGGPQALAQFFATLAEKRVQNASTSTIFIVRHCERQFTRGDYNSDPEFFHKLHVAITKPAVPDWVTNIHVAVACLGTVPSELPTHAHRHLPVQCYFEPPGAEERERLFRKFFEQLQTHTASVSTLCKWLSWDIDDECIAFLADHSQSRSVGEIREFAVKVYHSVLGLFYEGKPFTVDFDFVRSHLVQNEFLNEVNTDDREDQFRRYAGVAQSYQKKKDIAEGFGQATKRARTEFEGEQKT